jgi:hypothetical protein
VIRRARPRSGWLSFADIESFINREAVEACIAWDVRARAPMQSVRYYAFVDPSDGSADSMSLAIGHREDDIVVVDALREIKPPFSPDSVVGEFSALLKSYRVGKITGDRYAGEWPREHFREHGIIYEPAQKPKSDLYRDLLPVINWRKLARTARGGRDSIDHAPGAHDDLANVVAGLAAVAKRGSYDSSLSWVSGPDDDFQRQRLSQHIRQTGGYYRQMPPSCDGHSLLVRSVMVWFCRPE